MQQSGPAEPSGAPAAGASRPPAASSTSSAPAPARPAPSAPAQGVRDVQTSSAATQQQSGFAAAAGAEPGAVLRSSSAPRIEQSAGTSRQGNRPAKQETVVKDEWSKTPRNAPCPCGSGKKFKMCHGAS